MGTTAIICEYNPLHSGHVHQLQAAKAATSAHTLAAVMSGSFTQRGDIAIVDKLTRARHAILAGADIVLELPVVYAVNSAELFARGAAKTLSLFDDVTLSFGSECGDLEILKNAAAVVGDEPSEMSDLIREKIDDGLSYPRARSEAIAQFRPDIAKILNSPNNILAVEYIKESQKYNFKFHTVKRESGYNDLSLFGQFASASAIRAALQKGDGRATLFMPDYVTADLSRPCFNSALTEMLLYRLAGMSPPQLADIYNVSEGLENRILTAAKESEGYDELVEAIKSKRYTMARIKRILIYSLLNLTAKKAKKLMSSPPYARVLALRRGREDILAELGAATTNIIVRESDLLRVPDSVRASVELDSYASSVFSAAAKKPSAFNAIFVDTPQNTPTHEKSF